MESFDIFTFIGSISGIIAILTLIYVFGHKFGVIDTKLAGIENKLIDPIEFGKLFSKVETLYKVYVEDILHKEISGGNPSPIKQNPGSNPGSKNEIDIELSDELLGEIKKITKENSEKDSIDITTLLIGKLAGENPSVILEPTKIHDVKTVISKIYKEIEKIKKETFV